MGKKGRLTKERFGYGMPVDAPLFARPPIYYRDVEAISLTYETEEEAAADILPEGLELTTPATATVIIVRYPFSTLGPYEEAILGLSCTFNGDTKFYIAHIVVNTDIPLAAGREIWGYPKKFAHITLQKEGDLVIGTMERPKGNRICTGIIRPERPLPPAGPVRGGGSLSLRVIPSPDGSDKPSLAELIEVPGDSTPIESYEGAGSLQFNSTSLVDPWHKLAVKKMLLAVYRRNHMVLHPGKVVKRY
jgi:acetoacetate decarboxylase